MEAQKEIQELEEDKIKKEAKYNALKKDLIGKQDVLKKSETKLEEYQDAVEKHLKERDDLKNECSAFKENIEKYVDNINNLQKMISQAEQDLQNQKKEMNVVLSERDFLSEQLIERNEEIKGLYEKIKSLQQEEVKMHKQYEKLLLEIEGNRSTRDYLIEEYEKTENIIKNIFDLKVVKIKLEKEVLIAKNKVRSLEDETKKRLNIHRWTKLEYSDPEKFELIQQINSLQRRLNAKTEEVSKKEDLIQEKEKLYIKLKHIVARQSGMDMEEPLSKFKAKIKEEGQRLKKLKEKIKSHQLEIRNYEYEIKRIVNNTDKLKQAWFKRLDEQGFNPNLINEVEDEEYDDNNEDDEQNDYNDNEYEDEENGEDYEYEEQYQNGVKNRKSNSV
jgi:chromosome segregation ATPase